MYKSFIEAKDLRLEACEKALSPIEHVSLLELLEEISSQAWCHFEVPEERLTNNQIRMLKALGFKMDQDSKSAFAHCPTYKWTISW